MKAEHLKNFGSLYAAGLCAAILITSCVCDDTRETYDCERLHKHYLIAVGARDFSKEPYKVEGFDLLEPDVMLTEERHCMFRVKGVWVDEDAIKQRTKQALGIE